MPQPSKSALVFGLAMVLSMLFGAPALASQVTINQAHQSVKLDESGFVVEIPDSIYAGICRLEVFPVDREKVAAADQYYLTRAVDLNLTARSAPLNHLLKAIRLTFSFDEIDFKRASDLDASQPLGRFRIGRWDNVSQGWQELPSIIFWDGRNGKIEAASIYGAGRYALLWSNSPGTQLSAMAGDDIRLMVNYEVKQPLASPLFENGRVMIPLRFVENMGFSIKWFADDQRIELTKGSRDTLILWVGKYDAKKGDVSYSVETPPKIINGYTYVPLRFVAESLGADVNWDPLEKTASILVQ